MTIIIKNKMELLSNAETSYIRRAREIILDVIEKSLNSVDPRTIIKSKVLLKDNRLIINDKIFNLDEFDKIFVVGGGKASGSMAKALEEILGSRIEDGVIVVPRGESQRYKMHRIRVVEGSHPIPDERSVASAKEILNLAGRVGEKDLVIGLISGGGSALMALPYDGITLGDKQRVTDLLLRSGATINEINIIRKHLSGIKGGRLAKSLYPATILCLLLSDVLGDPLDVIASGPTVPDSSTFSDALDILERYDLLSKIPVSIRELLMSGAKGLVEETPKADDPAFKKVHNVVIGNNRLACETAAEELKSSGFNTMLLTSLLEGEARHVGTVFGTVAKEISRSGNPISPPAAIIAGGETTVTVTGQGKGGRNQELCLGAALKIQGLEKTVLASVSTDGVDGPTDSAGALVDGWTIARSKRLGMEANDYLRNNDSYSFFSRLGDLVMTGPTGTNVNDITILLVI
ncbi:MAG: glycerate kinase [Nitrososphaerota archaeon]|nr:glycerate kinase [Candidatus Bathyarchaeota archaeon]MDW8049254.1 glycerate kinase [Nitrososphaerota archaeon]